MSTENKAVQTKNQKDLSKLGRKVILGNLQQEISIDLIIGVLSKIRVSQLGLLLTELDCELRATKTLDEYEDTRRAFSKFVDGL